MTMNFTFSLRLAATLLMLSLSCSVFADPPEKSASPASEEPVKAPYLLSGAPTFDMTIASFREKYNSTNPKETISEFRAIPDKSPETQLTRAASKINEDLYASTALEKGSGKVKTIQITYLPIKGNDEKTARTLAITYMANVMRQFDSTLSPEQSINKINILIEKGKGSPFFQEQCGALRYVISDNGEKGLTFAVEPIKLTLEPVPAAINDKKQSL
jgi:hypothetical protein